MLWKEDTTPPTFEVGVRRGLEGLAGATGVTLDQLLEGASLVHGTTAATNTVVERSGPRTALVCSRGFRDVLYFRDGFKWSRFDRHLPRPPDLVERSLRLPVEGRVDSSGREVRALDEDDVLRAAEVFRKEGVGAVAVALLWSHVNPAHELRVRELLARVGAEGIRCGIESGEDDDQDREGDDELHVRSLLPGCANR